MYDDDDDDDGKGTDDDVNRTPTAFAKKNHQQPESYRSSPQKHQAYHGYTGKAMIRPGFNKSIQARQCRGIENENIVPVTWLKTL